MIKFSDPFFAILVDRYQIDQTMHIIKNVIADPRFKKLNCRVVNAIIIIFFWISRGDLLRTLQYFFIAGVKLNIVEPITLQLENGVEIDDDTYMEFDIKSGFVLEARPTTFTKAISSPIRS